MNVAHHLEMASLMPKPMREDASQLFQHAGNGRLARMRSASRWVNSTNDQAIEKRQRCHGGRHDAKGEYALVARRINDKQGEERHENNGLGLSSVINPACF